VRTATKRRQEEKPPAPLPERPRLAPDARVHEPIEDGAPWLVQSGAQRYLRVAAGMASLLRLADGTRDAEDMAKELGWSVELVGEGLLRAQRTGLLEDAADKPRRERRITFVPPLTVQFTVVRPERMLNVFRPLTARLAHRGWAIVAATLAGAGLLALVAQAQTTIAALSEPISLPALLALLVVTYCGTMLHELSHGLVLSHYGGRPSRMGFMLFYLTPAFFCDVSDGWRLPRNRQRVRVALAGIATQTVIAGLAGVGSVVVAVAGGNPAVRDFLLLLTVTNYVSGLFNTIPFVKLDGYLALMSHLDISHLRDRSITDARRLVARLLFGGRYLVRAGLHAVPAVCRQHGLHAVGVGSGERGDGGCGPRLRRARVSVAARVRRRPQAACGGADGGGGRVATGDRLRGGGRGGCGGAAGDLRAVHRDRRVRGGAGADGPGGDRDDRPGRH
jgi:putative peptide zinc metalloprotease protein